MSGLRNEGVFTPPSVQGTLVYPGNLGGINWSGYAYDPAHQLLIVKHEQPCQQRFGSSRAIDRLIRNGRGKRAITTCRLGSPYVLLRRFLQSSVAPALHAAAVGHARCGGSRAGSPPVASRDWFHARLRRRAPDAPPGSLSLGGPIVTAAG